MHKNLVVATTNHHTPYTCLLSKVFPKIFVIGTLNTSQLIGEQNTRKIKFMGIINLLLSHKKVVVICNALLKDIFIFISFILFGKKARVVVHGNILHGWGKNSFFCFLKYFMYKFASVIIHQNNIITISDHAKMQLGLKKATVIRPFVKIHSKSPAKGLKLS
jgi:hypothetical protein